MIWLRSSPRISGVHGRNILISNIKRKFSTSCYILRIKYVVKNADRPVPRSLRHHEKTNGHGRVRKLFISPDSIADGVTPASKSTRNDICAAFILEFMHRYTIYLHINAPPRCIDKHLTNKLWIPAGCRNLGSFIIRMKTILLYQNIQISLVKTLPDIRQLLQVEHTALVKLPLTVLIHEYENKSILTGLGVPQLDIPYISGSQTAISAAGDTADITKLFQARRFRLVMEEVIRETPFLR